MHKAGRVSAAARELIHAGFEAGTSYDAIIAQVHAATGEKVSRGGLSRYWRFWQAQARAREAKAMVRDLLKEFTATPSADLERLLEGLAASTLMETMAQAESKDLYLPDLLKGQAALLKANLGKRQLAVEEGKLDLARRRFEQALGRVEEKVKAVGKVLDPEVLAMIREEVYGLPA